jgi:hypothetical protein
MSFIEEASFKKQGSKEVAFTAQAESYGAEVAGVGQRKTTTLVSNKDGRVTSDKFVESYVGKNDGDIIAGGIVSKKGSGVYTGRKALEVSGDKPGKAVYYDPETGLESATPTLNLKQSRVPTTAKIFDVRSATQSEVPESGLITQKNVVNYLKGEKRVFKVESFGSGSVNSVAREQISNTGSVVQLKPLNVKGVGLVDLQIKSAVSQGTASNNNLIPVVLSSNKQESTTKELNKPIQTNDTRINNLIISSPKLSFKTLESESVIKSKSSNEISTDSRTDTLSSVMSRVKSKSSTRSINLVESKPSVSTEILPSSKVGNAVEFKPSTKQSSQVISKTVLVNRFNNVQPITTIAQNTNTTVFSLPNSRINNKGNFGVDVRRFGKFKTLAKSGLSKEEAVKLGSGFAKSTLGATYRLTLSGRTIRSSAPSKQFYTKGVNVIERSSYRLNRVGEVREINQRKNNKNLFGDVLNA